MGSTFSEVSQGAALAAKDADIDYATELCKRGPKLGFSGVM